MVTPPLPFSPEDQALADALLGHSVDLLRLDAHLRDEVLKVLREMEQQLRGQLGAADLSAYNKARIDFLLSNAKAVIDDYYARVQTLMQGAISDIPRLQATVVTKSLLDIGLGAALPTSSHLTALASDILIQGAPAASWWKRQAAETVFKYALTLRQGVTQGLTNTQIISNLVGNPKQGVSGVLTIAKHNAAALVQTSVQSVANASRLSVFEQNADVIKELEWLTTLDGHVCPLCIARSGLRWTNNQDGVHDSVEHDIPFQDPPIHFNDRCVLLPITKTFKDLGLDAAEVKRTTRASHTGQVAASTTFDQFLKRKGKAFQEEVLGKGRADLWRNGTITLQQLVDLRGNPLTLAQLQEKYA